MLVVQEVSKGKIANGIQVHEQGIHILSLLR